MVSKLLFDKRSYGYHGRALFWDYKDKNLAGRRVEKMGSLGSGGEAQQSRDVTAASSRGNISRAKRMRLK